MSTIKNEHNSNESCVVAAQIGFGDRGRDFDALRGAKQSQVLDADSAGKPNMRFFFSSDF